MPLFCCFHWHVITDFFFPSEHPLAFLVAYRFLRCSPIIERESQDRVRDGVLNIFPRQKRISGRESGSNRRCISPEEGY
jgi:hypothetical protein